MADDALTLRIDADAGPVKAAAREAEGAIGRIGDAAKRESGNVTLYGERLGRVFGPGEGLHGRLDALEMPLRDVEGGFDRARQAAFVFGNKAQSASEKATQGFLLAADTIAAFTSGGIAGIAITAAVAGFALLAKAMQDEAEAAEQAKKAQEEHLKTLGQLGKQAVDAGTSIAALNAQQAAAASLAEVRSIEQQRIEQRLQRQRLADELEAATLARQSVRGRVGELRPAIRREREARQALDAQDRLLAGLDAGLRLSQTKAKEAQAFYLADLELSQRSAVTSFVEALKKTTAEGAAAIRAVAAPAGAPAAGRAAAGRRGAAPGAAAVVDAMAQAEADFDQAIAEARIREEEEAAVAMLGVLTDAERARFAELEAAAEAEMLLAKRVADFKASLTRDGLEIAQQAAMLTTSTLLEQAKAGELSAEKLLEAVLDQTSKTLVAKGTLYALEGVASFNPVTAAGGAAMIAAGLAMGAASGSISRAGTPAAASRTPTDTRGSRAASGAGSGGDGGTLVVNFNGPAYDRRGVADVLNAGQRMARHRRLQGA